MTDPKIILKTSKKNYWKKKSFPIVPNSLTSKNQNLILTISISLLLLPAGRCRLQRQIFYSCQVVACSCTSSSSLVPETAVFNGKLSPSGGFGGHTMSFPNRRRSSHLHHPIYASKQTLTPDEPHAASISQISGCLL
jgi:hypothetical protein